MLKVLKYQFKLFIFLLVLTVVPLTLIYEFLPYEFDESYYFFLTLLVGLRFSFFKGQAYLDKVKKNIRDDMTAELGRIPSTNEMVKRVNEVVSSRDYVFGLCGVLIVLVVALYGKL
jgi:hypothetical protein